MPRWLYEAGIGENRAVLIEDGKIVEAAIELPGSHLRVGAVLEGKLGPILIPGRRAIVFLPGGHDVLLEPLPPKLTEGQAIRVEVVRESLWEAQLLTGLAKRAKVRVTEENIREGPTLRERLERSGRPVKLTSLVQADILESAGWSEVLDQAERGVIEFEGGTLLMSLTAAMTIFDVDGSLPPTPLAVAGARAAARAIRLFGIGGSIGIDLPTLASRGDRQAAAAAFDAALPQPFERTAVNGFGFLQIVRRRERASLPEVLQFDPASAAARALLRRAERCGGVGERTICAAPAVIESLRYGQFELERRIGASVALQPDPSLAISGGHVQSAHP